jgi:hypothetical protein
MVWASVGGGAGIVRRNKTNSRKAGGPCQGENIALHHASPAALPHELKM